MLTAALPELADGDFYYQALGGGHFRSTIHAQGAWNEHEQHMAPASGLLADSLERHEPRSDMRMARLSYEILGLIPGGEFHIDTTTLRPGRTIELLQAELVANGRVAIRATAWRMITSDTSAVAAVEDTAIPAPDECKPLRRRQRLAGRVHPVAGDARGRGPPARRRHRLAPHRSTP